MLTFFTSGAHAVGLTMNEYQAFKSGPRKGQPRASQDPVVRYLAAVTELRAPRDGFKYRCLEEFVLKNGRFMGARSPEPDKFRSGRMGQCFANAFRLMLSGLQYVEGFAAGIIPVLHAWLVDGEGRVIDPTWRTGEVYFGVVFPAEFVIETVLARGRYGVLDNYERGFPLLRGEDPWVDRSVSST